MTFCPATLGVLDRPPSRVAQAALLTELRRRLEPIVIREHLPLEFRLKPGMRLRRTYGRCTWTAEDPVPTITIRCTADEDRTQWRRVGAIVGTLLHEITHLRYRSHGPRFWALHRRLIDRAAAAGVYDPTDRDPAERGRGDEKLAGSAAWSVALAAREKRLERTRLRAEVRAGVSRVTPPVRLPAPPATAKLVQLSWLTFFSN